MVRKWIWTAITAVVLASMWVDAASACGRRCERAARQGAAACEEARDLAYRRCAAECGDDEECLRACRARVDAQYQSCIERVRCGYNCCTGYCDGLERCRAECGDNRRCFRACKESVEQRTRRCLESCG